MKRARFRDQRVFHVDDPGGKAGGWYFEVREGSPRGPYLTRGLAERALTDFLVQGVGGAEEPDAG